MWASASCSRRARRATTPICAACIACATRPNTSSGRAWSMSKFRMAATSLPAIYVHAEPANGGGKVPAVVFFDGLDVTKEIQYLKGVADLVARGIACLIVDGPGNGESIRFRNLYLRHDTEHYATPAVRISRRPAGNRCQAHRRHGDQPGRLLRAARGGLRAALCLLHRLGRAVGLPEDLARPLRAAVARRYAVAVGRRRSTSHGC